MRRTARRTRNHPDDQGVFGLPGDVAPWDIRFDPDDAAFVEHLATGQFRIRVWAEPALDTASVVVRHTDGVTEYPMEPIGTLRQVIHETVIGPFETNVEYSIALRSRTGKPVYLTPDGVAVAIERLDRWVLDAEMPSLDIPDWSAGAVMYQIFPDRFANGDPTNDPVGVAPWGSKPGRTQFQGGDLQGVIDHLGHLSWLGVDVIYLNPIFTSPSNHKYDTADYWAVDPAFGGEESLRGLVEAAHGFDMKVILDASFNHVHPRFFAFQDVVANGAQSDYAEWFVVRSFPLTLGVREHLMGPRHPMRSWLARWTKELGLPTVPLEGEGRVVEPSYESWYGVANMPRLDLSNPETRRYVLDVAQYWLTEFDIDGWRMDVARYVDPDFWADFRLACRTVKPDCYLMSEIMGDGSHWLQGDRFDGTMNYTFRATCLDFLATETIDGAEFLDRSSRTIHQYAWPVTLSSQNLIGSHDTPRFLTEAHGDEWRLLLATVLQLTMPGMPGIYYGDEMELSGGEDPACRAAFPWDVDPTSKSTALAISELASVRTSRPELVTGAWRPVTASRDLAVFERVGRRRTLVAVNRSSRSRTFDANRRYSKVLWGAGHALDGTVTVLPRSALLLGSV